MRIRELSIDWGEPGLVGQLYFTVMFGSTVLVPRTNVGVQADPSNPNSYYVDVNWQDEWTTGRITWDKNGGEAQTFDFDTASATGAISPPIEQPTVGQTGSKVIKVEYPTGSILDAKVRSPDGTKLWNVVTKQFVTVNPLTANVLDYIIPLQDMLTGMYVGDFPPIPPPYNLYPVFITLRGPTASWSDKEVGSGEIGWNGYTDISAVIIPLTSYTDVSSGDAYFSTQLYAEKWENSNNNKKQKALNRASQIIDNFRYKGIKTNSLQTHEFPRSGLIDISNTLIPKDIEYAQYEIAIALLKGYDPERLASSQNISSRGFGAVRTTYDTSRTPEWLLNGIPSMTAWAYLLPYFNRDDSGSIKLHRAS